MLNGFNDNGDLKGVKVTENGELLVKMNGENGTTINNTSENPVPVSGNVTVANQTAIPVSGNVGINNVETTLYAGIMTLTTTEQTIGVNKKVTEISIANYSETANVIVSVDNANFTIAPNLALDLPINKTVAIVGISATEEDTKVQYVIKGEA